MQLKRLLIILAVLVGVLVVAIMGMYKSWNAWHVELKRNL